MGPSSEAQVYTIYLHGLFGIGDLFGPLGRSLGNIEILGCLGSELLLKFSH